MTTRAIKLGALIAFLASIAILTPLFGNAVPHQRKTRPDISRIANLSGGRDTMLTAQGLYGPGMPDTSGLFDTSLRWRSRQTGWYLYVNGNDARRIGNTLTAVIDEITLAEPSDFSAVPNIIPYTSLPRRYCVLAGGFKLGMKESTALKLARTEGDKTMIDGNEVSWAKAGFVRVNHDTTYTAWTVTLDFDNRRNLDCMTIDCE
jgi:hypothetical protein